MESKEQNKIEKDSYTESRLVVARGEESLGTG